MLHPPNNLSKQFFLLITVIIFLLMPSIFSDNCPCQNYGTETACNKVFQNRGFLCQSAVMRSEALKCAKTCQICCERPEYKCSNQKDELTCQQWQTDGWCISQRTVMENLCPNKCGLCNSAIQSAECRDRDMAFCAKTTPNDCVSENPLVKYKVQTKCPKMCGWC